MLPAMKNVKRPWRILLLADIVKQTVRLAMPFCYADADMAGVVASLTENELAGLN
jgi:hypothetical protein